MRLAPALQHQMDVRVRAGLTHTCAAHACPASYYQGSCDPVALMCRPKSGVTKTGLAGFFANCPENAFQRVPQGYKPFTPLQRSGAVIRNGAKLLGVGFGASLIGVSITNALIFLRQQMDPSWSPQNAPQVQPSRSALMSAISTMRLFIANPT